MPDIDARTLPIVLFSSARTIMRFIQLTSMATDAIIIITGFLK